MSDKRISKAMSRALRHDPEWLGLELDQQGWVELKELVRGMQVADAQLRMHEDTLKVLAVGRQSMAMQLNDRLKNVTPLPENG